MNLINELRIGNYVQYLSGDTFQIQSVDFGLLESMPDRLHPKPIPLTVDWLFKFGACNTTANNTFGIKFSIHSLHTIYVSVTETDNIATIGDNFTGKEFLCVLVNPVVDYVHQLQNLFYALTGEELTLKEQPNQ
ncbi:MAG: hypothetical protein QOA70_06810 [Nitrososphaeraceae archaeon]|nr:hypothetical protein [Nitrososphaeraceae archaeon]